TYHYAPVRGTKDFTEGVFNWVFGENADMIRKNFKYSVIPTTGGSGAISNSFYNFNDFNQKVLLPNYYWSPYQNFALEANVDLKTFLMYDENFKFNIADFKSKALELAKEQNRLCVLLNDPSNNPTGLCMTKADWHEVVQTLNEVNRLDIPVILIHDIAYIDYQLKDNKYSREIFEAYQNLDEDILAIVVFSGSKTFSLYGFRVGAQIGLSKSQEIVDNFVRVGDYSVRGRFSSVSQPGINIIGKIFTHNDYKIRFEQEMSVARNLLKARANLFLAEAEKNDLEILPYCGGFFISVPTKNKNIFRDLVNDHVFVIPMQDIIRVAISSLSIQDIPELVKKIKKHI
ncbi:MAG: aminotransferase class I/II-fold pyridoxal phosphate-dependent enzyme, partial [Flavobacteriaceae bacterium]|nr:aminotransferase class I/II-fold pyridoxal phosphate-dependent enzyme [Flavobacteriaceae bacterium]